MVISKEDTILIENLCETKGYGTCKLLKQCSGSQKIWRKRRFRQLDYVLILFMIVTVKKFLK